MSDSFNHIDDIFREGLQNAKITPPTTGFAQIQSRRGLEASSQHAVQSQMLAGAKMGILKMTLISFTAVLALTIGYVVIQNLEGNKKQDSSKGVHENPKAQSNIENNTVSSQDVTTELDQLSENTFQKGKRDIETLRMNQPRTNATITNSKNHISENISAKNIENPLNSEKTEILNDVKNSNPTEQKSSVVAITPDCKSKKIHIEFPEDVLGAHEIAFRVNGELGQYDWGCKKEVWGSKWTKSVDWKGPVYVKKSQELNFWIRVKYADGCRDSQSMIKWIQPVNNEEEELFPTVFTPNEDGYNDSFYVKIPKPEKYEMTVIDFKGYVVFQSKDFDEKWGGKYLGNLCNEGIYTVILRRKYHGENLQEVKTYKLNLKRN